jgi:Peptidase family S41/N-terminal domain of Peptidase_S41 in eukaryotic IRBP
MRMAILASAAALAWVSSNGGAQQARPVAAAAQADPQRVVADVQRILAANYVLADVRPKLDAALSKGLAAGRYNVTDPTVLADRINADLSAVAHDKHLGMHYDPKQAGELAARPARAGADDAPPSPEEILQATRFNHGITELKVLPGNVRYMNLVGFFWGGPKTAEAYDNAMRFLQDGDAAIIDLRENGGGSPEAVQYLVSHFLEPNKPIVTFYMGANKVDKLSSLASLPSGRLVGKPLYVLTSGGTASAAEEFTGHVAGFKLGEVIGEDTAGAGFRNEFFPVAGGYVISVSVGRAVLASTGKDWEGVGIAPTTRIEPDKALDLAQVHALRRLAETASPDDKRSLSGRAALLEAKLNPIATALPLQRYAGIYGERSVTMDGPGLVYQRKGGPKVPIIAVAANEFSFNEDPGARIRFTVSGNDVTALELVRSDGTKVEAQRTQ